jgi:two-component system chemotaxis response regulator CheB
MSDTRPSAPFDVVVLVGSAGATPVARSVLSALPADFPAAVVYVQHRAATQPLMLVDLLRRRVKMPVVAARDEQPIEPGVVHVAMPGQETRVEEGRFRIRDGRCLGDPLLAGVAAHYGPRSLAVILSGRLDDGAAGLRLVKQAGGRGLVQDPFTCAAPSMPRAALATGCYDFVLSPRRIAEAVVTLVAVPGAAELFAVRARPVLELSHA